MTATKFMNIARKFKDTLILPSDSIEALALLAAPSTPESVRVEAIERVVAAWWPSGEFDERLTQ